MYPQLIQALSTALPWLAIALSIGVALYTSFKFRRSFASRSMLNKLRAENAELSGDLADLADRFSRFQKREGMRAARSEKTSNADLLAEAQALVAQGGPTDHAPHQSKLDLYKHISGTKQ